MAFNPYAEEFVPNHFKNKKMCEGAIEDEAGSLEFEPDHFKN